MKQFLAVFERGNICSITFVLILYFVLIDNLYLYNYLSKINMFKLKVGNIMLCTYGTV